MVCDQRRSQARDRLDMPRSHFTEGNIICPGLDCGRRFKNNAALSAHQRSCRPKLVAAAKIGLEAWSKKAQADRDMQQSAAVAPPPEVPGQALEGQLELDGNIPDDAEFQVRRIFIFLQMPILMPRKRDATPALEFRPSGLPKRRTRLPVRFRDELPPTPLPQMTHQHEEIADNTAVSAGPEQVEPEIPAYKMQADSYGIYRLYRGGPPSFTPDELHTVEQVCVFLHLKRRTFS